MASAAKDILRASTHAARMTKEFVSENGLSQVQMAEVAEEAANASSDAVTRLRTLLDGTKGAENRGKRA